MKNKVIAISREYASDGGNIAKRAAELLGIPCHDSDIIDVLAERSEFAESFIVENGEYAVYKSKLFEMLVSRDMGGKSAQDRLYSAQVDLIRQFAAEGPCVIVGRCSEYILREQADVLSVFIHADMPDRIERLTGEGKGGDNPEQFLRDRDARRKAYYFAHTDFEWGLATNYDVVLNSRFGTDVCASIIASLYRQR